MANPQQRYSLRPFFEITGWTMSQVNKACPCNGPEYAKRRAHGVTELHADRLACAVGLHPSLVWPEWNDGSARCASCGAPFPPRDKQSLYCGKRCRNREKMRRYRATEHGAETNRRHRRSYYQENREYELAQWRLRAARTNG